MSTRAHNRLCQRTATSILRKFPCILSAANFSSNSTRIADPMSTYPSIWDEYDGTYRDDLPLSHMNFTKVTKDAKQLLFDNDSSIFCLPNETEIDTEYVKWMFETVDSMAADLDQEIQQGKCIPANRLVRNRDETSKELSCLSVEYPSAGGMWMNNVPVNYFSIFFLNYKEALSKRFPEIQKDAHWYAKSLFTCRMNSPLARFKKVLMHSVLHSEAC